VSVPSDGSPQATFAATLVDEWVRAGVRDAVVCPGSRSTPLAMALAARSELRLHVRLDERSAGFFALGVALATGTAPVVCTTSGTAAAELHAAVVEAHHARVPMLVCTADRPPELQDVGAPQTIDQRRLYGSAVRWQADPGVPDLATWATWRPLAARALAEALHGPDGPGPVHLDLAFREPLTGEPGPLPPGRPDGTPALGVLAAPRAPVRSGLREVAGWRGRRGVIVAGARCGPAAKVLDLGAVLGWPVLADPRSGCRVARAGVVAAADSFLRAPEVRRALRPEVVLVLGEPWASRNVGDLVRDAAAAGAEVLAVDAWWRVLDPHGTVTGRHHADPAAWLGAALDLLGEAPAPVDGWLETWTALEATAQRAIDDALESDEAARGGTITEPSLARSLPGLLPPGAALLVGSSMPVRDLEWFGPPLPSPPAVFANRGANGIDGLVSTALGLAAGRTGPVVALLGDLAFLHDVSGLVALGPAPATPCALVVVDNGGGGIFSLLPQAAEIDPRRFELLFGTPPVTDVGQVASGFGLPVRPVRTLGELAGALGAALEAAGPSVIRASVPSRAANAALHEQVHAAVAAAVAPLVAESPAVPPRPERAEG